MLAYSKQGWEAVKCVLYANACYKRTEIQFSAGVDKMPCFYVVFALVKKRLSFSGPAIFRFQTNYTSSIWVEIFLDSIFWLEMSLLVVQSNSSSF